MEEDPSTKRSGRGNRALFVDRDGTLNPDLRYLKDADRLEVYHGVGEGLAMAAAHGYRVVCVTNQSGVERGLYAKEDVERIHARLNEKLRSAGAHVDAFYYCPHAPETGCACRKPGTLLFEQAAAELGLDFATSAVIGDRALDVEAGRRLGLLTVVVLPPGHEAQVAAELTDRGLAPDLSALTFRSAVYRVLARG